VDTICYLQPAPSYHRLLCMRFFGAYRDHMTTSDLPYIIAIGASGGEGLQDMVDLLNVLPKPLAAIVMLVLHRPVDRISHLQAVLSRRSGLHVIVASEAERKEMGTCYIGEPDGHLTLMAKVTGTGDTPSAGHRSGAPTPSGRQKSPVRLVPDHCAGGAVAVVVVHDRSKTSFATTTPTIPPMQKQKRPNNRMGIRNTTLSSESAVTICVRTLAPRRENQPRIRLIPRHLSRCHVQGAQRAPFLAFLQEHWRRIKLIETFPEIKGIARDDNDPGARTKFASA
jgi:CheB methylesterase